MRPLLVALVVLVACTPAAGAATARVDAYQEPAGIEPESSCSRYMMCPPEMLVFTASPGEVNDVSITREGSGFRVHDAGAPVEAASGCQRVDAQTVTCFAQVVASVALGDGNDRITAAVRGAAGGDGDDVLTVGGGDGGAGNDVVSCVGAGSCNLSGGPGSDRVTGGPGADEISGDAGGAGDDDLLDGGGGVDLLSYAGHTAPVAVELAGAEQRVASPGESDSIARFERVAGGAGDDVLGGAEGVTVDEFLDGMRGGAGNDLIVVRSPMNVYGEAGNDRISGPSSTLGIVGGSGDDHLTGGPGPDLIEGSGGRDTIGGGDGPDRLEGGSGDDALTGGAGNDRLQGDGGADVMLGQSGDDTLAGADNRLGNDRLTCGDGRRDRGVADRRDRVTGCERVTRRRGR